MALTARTVIFLFMYFFSASSTCHSTLDTCLFSLDNFVRSHQHIRWNRQADLLGRFQVDDELKLRRLFHRQISRLCAFQNLVHIDGDPTIQVGIAWTVVHKPPLIHIFWSAVDRREPALYREVRNLSSVKIKDGGRQH